jgi:hypothetical protein
VPVFVPPPDTADDLVRKFGIAPEQAAGGSPDLAWLLDGGGGVAHLYAAGDRLPGGIEAVLGREENDLVLWVDRLGALISGDTLVDFGRGFETWPLRADCMIPEHFALIGALIGVKSEPCWIT